MRNRALRHHRCVSASFLRLLHLTTWYIQPLLGAIDGFQHHWCHRPDKRRYHSKTSLPNVSKRRFAVRPRSAVARMLSHSMHSPLKTATGYMMRSMSLPTRKKGRCRTHEQRVVDFFPRTRSHQVCCTASIFGMGNVVPLMDYCQISSCQGRIK